LLIKIMVAWRRLACKYQVVFMNHKKQQRKKVSYNKLI